MFYRIRAARTSKDGDRPATPSRKELAAYSHMLAVQAAGLQVRPPLMDGGYPAAPSVKDTLL